jgi:hypothetical protein
METQDDARTGDDDHPQLYASGRTAERVHDSAQQVAAPAEPATVIT